MNLVTHKYTPAEMSDQELEATFAAREHTVDYLIKALRDQMHKGTLSSYVITGPRGAGKSTVVQMIDLRIRKDADLSAAWIPVIFPEEQFNMTSLRDMLAATLQILAKQSIPPAQEWLNKVEAEPNEEQSEQLAITGLREITRQTGKRFVLFIENLDHLLENYLNDKMKGTLRRLLMSDAFMMIVGSTVHIFDALKNYDEAFFNYFGQVPLNRLDADQVSELLRKRAEYDRNERFLRELPKQQAKVKTLVHLTGGNPRFVLMLYELLSLQQVTTIVQYLRRLVDELTPLLKDEMENLPPQQRKIIHALMERGGTAQPTDLTGPTRLPLNAINTQLKRLKDAQIVEVLGGGKGRAANYTVPDKLFSIWYQMRYLSQNRRRIELFVEVLRIWFEEEERIQTLRQLSERAQTQETQVLRDCATTAEYIAASLRGTAHEHLATELCVGSWVKADLKEAAYAYADLGLKDASKRIIDEGFAHAALGAWLTQHDDPLRGIQALNQALAKPQTDAGAHASALILRGFCKGKSGDERGAIEDCSNALALQGLDLATQIEASFIRAVAKSNMGDNQGAISDYDSVVDAAFPENHRYVEALFSRASIKQDLREFDGAVVDCTRVIDSQEASKEQIALAHFSRAINRSELGDTTGELADYSEIINLDGAPARIIAKALVNRGYVKVDGGDVQGGVADYSLAADLKDAPDDQVARALIGRAMARELPADASKSIADLNCVLSLKGITPEELVRAYFARGYVKLESNNLDAAVADFTLGIEVGNAPPDGVAHNLNVRGWTLLKKGKLEMAIQDWFRVLDIGMPAGEMLSSSAELAFITCSLMGNATEAEKVLEKLATAVNQSQIDRARQQVLGFLNGIAMPPMKTSWPIAWRKLATGLKAETVDAIRFLEPVCAVLEGKDRVLLDALPPEQREFAVEVLAKFEPKPNAEPVKASKTKSRKRASSLIPQTGSKG